MDRIYIAAVTDDAGETRYIVRASSAGEAGEYVARIHFGRDEKGTDRIEVGRLGSYDPTMTGAALAPLSIIGTWSVDDGDPDELVTRATA